MKANSGKPDSGQPLTELEDIKKLAFRDCIYLEFIRKHKVLKVLI
jgi:hypothetical protein